MNNITKSFKNKSALRHMANGGEVKPFGGSGNVGAAGYFNGADPAPNRAQTTVGFGSRVAQTGGPYAYVEAAFGRFPGFLAGVLLWMTGTTAMAGVASAFADGAATLAGMPALRVPIIVGAITLLAAVNVRGV